MVESRERKWSLKVEREDVACERGARKWSKNVEKNKA